MTPKRLLDCQGADQQAAWIECALRSGRTLSDSELWLAGVDQPKVVIARLRRRGCSIITTKKRVADAADEVHEDLAWHMGKNEND